MNTSSDHVRRAAIFFDANEDPAAIQLCMSGAACETVRTVLGEGAPEPSLGMVLLTTDQAIKLALWSGNWRPADSPDYAIGNALDEVLVKGFFNYFWEDGLSSALAGERPL